MMTVYRYIKIRRSKVACAAKVDTEEFLFPNQLMVDSWFGIPFILIGFENDNKDGTGKVLIVRDLRMDICLSIFACRFNKKIGLVDIYFE
jgi:hypothetical protein